MDEHPLSTALEDQFRRDVDQCGLAELWPRLRALAGPSYIVELVPDADLDRLGTSRLGGLPDLPVGLAWPEREGQLLTFIGQVNLAEVPLPPVPLPERGMLSFFLGIDEPASNIVHEVRFWDKSAGRLSRPSPPDESRFLNEDCTTFQAVGVRFLPAVSLPSFFRDASLDEFSDRLEELRQKLGSPSSPGKASQLLGHPLAIAGDPLAEGYVAVHGHANIIYDLHRTPEEADRDLAAAEAEADAERIAWLRRRKESLDWFHRAREHHQREIANWQLLLEVASHRPCGMCWWDAGRLQFLIDSRDLEARDFSRTYACIQTS
jgi:hypothetical protein